MDLEVLVHVGYERLLRSTPVLVMFNTTVVLRRFATTVLALGQS